MSPRRILAGRRERGSATIELAPLLDMVFILLIFFVVTTSFVKPQAVRINQPKSAHAKAVTGKVATLSLDAQGVLWIEDRAVAPDDIESVRAALRLAEADRVLLRADKDLRTEILMLALDTCKSAGAQAVDIATDTPVQLGSSNAKSSRPGAKSSRPGGRG
jgi:Biopolymer transport protein